MMTQEVTVEITYDSQVTNEPRQWLRAVGVRAFHENLHVDLDRFQVRVVAATEPEEC